MKQLPLTPQALRRTASILDKYDTILGVTGHEVQDDLRRWADLIAVRPRLARRLRRVTRP